MEKINFKKSLTLVFFALLLPLILLLGLEPIPQPLEYHDFADKRVFIDIPNTFDVLSNLAFIFVGGGWFLWFQKIKSKEEPNVLKLSAYKVYQLFFLSVFFTGIGSAYYHWNPNNVTLFWDRLPLAVAMSVILAAVIAERISLKLGEWLTVPFIIYALFSVVYWEYSEQQGHGDLRFYILVQSLPLVLIPLILFMYPNPHKSIKNMVVAILGLLAARFTELYDKDIYELTNQMLSGHTLKHVFAAAAAFYVGVYFKSMKDKSDAVKKATN